MTQARLSLTMPDELWVGEVSREYPDALFKVLTAVPSDEAGYALFLLHSDSLDEIFPRIEKHPTIVEMSVLRRCGNEATVQFETTAPLVMLSARSAGATIEFPVEIQDGTASVELVGTHERLSAFGAYLGDAGIDYEIDYIQERVHRSQLLTERQQELLLAAVEMGYYDIPRNCSLTEIAEEVGIAKSTCSEMLHRIQATIVTNYVEETLRDPTRWS